MSNTVKKNATSVNGSPIAKIEAPAKTGAAKSIEAKAKATAELEKKLVEMEKMLKEKQEQEQELKTHLQKAQQERDHAKKSAAMAAKKTASIEDILIKTEALKSLTKQREYMKEKKAQLDAFFFGASETTGGNLVLTSQSGAVFETQSTTVLKEIKAHISAMIQENILETEKRMQEVMQD